MNSQTFRGELPPPYADLPDRAWVRLEVPGVIPPGLHRLEITARNTGNANAPSFSLAGACGPQGARPVANIGEQGLDAPLAVRSFVRWSDERLSSLASQKEPGPSWRARAAS